MQTPPSGSPASGIRLQARGVTMSRAKFSRTGTIALRTLKRPTVNDYKEIHISKTIGFDKDRLDLCREGGLDGLLHLMNNDHARVQALVPTIVNSLIKTDEGDVALINDNAWNNLFELCMVKESTIRVDAIWTVAILAASQECHEQIIGTFGWKTIISFAKSEDPDFKLAISILISNLVVNEQNQLKMIENGGMIVLLDQAKKTNEIFLKRAVAGALSNAVMEGDNAKEFAKEGGVELLKQFIATGDEELLQIVVSTIANIASSDEHDVKAKIVSEIGLETLVKLLSHKNPQVQRGAAVSVAHFCALEEHQTQMADLGVVDKFLHILSIKTDTVDIQHASVMGLSSLSQNAKISKTMYDNGVAQQLAPFASSDDHEVKSEANSAIANINLHAPPPPVEEKPATEAEKPIVSEPEPVSLSSSTSEEITGQMTELKVDDTEATPEYVPSQQQDNTLMREINDTSVVTEVISSPSVPKKEPLADLTTVSHLLEKIKDKDVNKQREGAAGLVALLKISGARDSVVNAVGVKGLGEIQNLFKVAKDLPLLLELCRVLSYSATTAAREKIRFAELAPVLLHLFTQGSPNQEEALNVVPPLAFKNVNNQAVFIKLGGLDALISLLKAGGNDDVKSRSAKALHAITFQNRQAQQLLSKKRALPFLVTLLESPNPSLQKSAAGAVYACADGNFNNQNELRKAGVIPPLIKLLSSPEEAVRQTCSGSFYALLRDNKKVQECSAGAIPAFIAMLGTSKSIPLLSNATASIGELIRGNEKNQEMFCNVEAVKSLVGLLHSPDFWVIWNTFSIISVLIKKKVPTKRREMFHHMNLEQALQPLLTHQQNTIKKEAAKLMSYVKDRV